MSKLHPSLLTAHALGIPMPGRMARLPLTEAGWPTLFFAAKVDGKHDLRVADTSKFLACIKKKLCWLCGEPLGRYLAFVIGPMCVINRVTSEPPSHFECAEYAVQVCPFMVHPRAHRREKHMPDGTILPGIGLDHNPGVMALWVTVKYEAFEAGTDHGSSGGVLLHLGTPERITWWAEGRAATPPEIRHAIGLGLPKLRDLAERQGPDSVELLGAQIAPARTLLPA
jgi:hypothetical protein